jgi:hypothetical protein
VTVSQCSRREESGPQKREQPQEIQPRLVLLAAGRTRHVTFQPGTLDRHGSRSRSSAPWFAQTALKLSVPGTVEVWDWQGRKIR